jgi:hypothetical protein
MRRIATLAIFLGFLMPMLASAPAHAQATRTWISGVGDDVNPCSRTAPCKTFAGAISKTAAGGEIDCLDPGGFGTVTITKSITLDCGGGGIVGSILASGLAGIIVNNAGANVIIRNLSINGAGGALGTRGVNILAANSVLVEHSHIMNFSQQCIADVRPSAGSLVVNDVDCRFAALAGIGTVTTGGVLKLAVSRFTSTNNGNGVSLNANTTATITNSVLSNNTNNGIDNEGAIIFADSNTIASNTTGVNNAANGNTRLSNNNIANNTGNGISNASGTVTTYGTNRNTGGTSGAVTAAGGNTSALGQQ